MKRNVLLWALPLTLLVHTAFSEAPETPLEGLPKTPETLLPPQLPPDPSVDRPEERDLPIDLEQPHPPERPERPARPIPGGNISSLLQQFHEQREALLQDQQAAREARLREWSESTERELDDVLDDIREQRRAWMEEQKAIREDLMQRMNEMRKEFRNRERDVIIENAREDARSLRERVGQD